jgi:hypothetical protein
VRCSFWSEESPTTWLPYATQCYPVSHESSLLSSSQRPFRSSHVKIARPSTFTCLDIWYPWRRRERTSEEVECNTYIITYNTWLVDTGVGERLLFPQKQALLKDLGFSTTVITISTVFLDSTLYNPLKVYRRFGGTYRLHILGSKDKLSNKPTWNFNLSSKSALVSCSPYFLVLKMEAIYASETSVDFKQATRYIPDDSTLQYLDCLLQCKKPTKFTWS